MPVFIRPAPTTSMPIRRPSCSALPRTCSGISRRFRGLAQELKKPLLRDHLLNNIFFDTCVYHQPGIDLLTKVIPVGNILFASEMIGAVRGIDPETGHYFDDTRRYVESAPALNETARSMIYEGNARRVFPRLHRALCARGL